MSFADSPLAPRHGLLVLALASAGLIAGCNPSVRAPQSTPGASADAASAELAWSRWNCGGAALEVAFAADAAYLRETTALTTLMPEASASGARYRGQRAAGGVGLWSKGDALSFSADGQSWVECARAAAAFSAWGQEPSWKLGMEGDRGTLQRPGLGEPLGLLVRSLRSEGGATLISADSVDGAVEIRLDDGICRDVMSGMPYPQSVAIDLPNRQLRGCGGDPAQLLRAQPWAIPTPVAGRELATLVFLDANGVSLQAPCNQHIGSYRLSGEGLTLTFSASSKKGCPAEIEQEDRRLIEALAEATRFDVDDAGMLNLIGPRGLIVQAQPAPLM